MELLKHDTIQVTTMQDVNSLKDDIIYALDLNLKKCLLSEVSFVEILKHTCFFVTH